MNAKERYIAVFQETGRKKLERVPSFVQYIREEFIDLHKNSILNDFRGELFNNLYFDIPMSLGFDSIFALFPSSIKFESVRVKNKEGKEIRIGIDGEPIHKKGFYYEGGYIQDLDILEEVENNVKIIDNEENIKKVLKYYEKLSSKIFPVLMVDGIFDKTWRAMGMSLFSKNIAKNSNFYQKIVQFYARICEINIEGLINALDSTDLVVNILDDVAYKNSLMISPLQWRRDYLKPYQKINSMIRDAGLISQVHSDGDVTELIPSLQEAGFLGLQGWEGGCDPYYINEHFPNFVVIGFGDVLQTLPYGSEEEIKKHVKSLMAALKENKHFIIGPSTVIFKEIPLENVKTFLAASKQYGFYQ